ncbi:MAG: OmpA family protein [Chitinophagales bacterium]
MNFKKYGLVMLAIAVAVAGFSQVSKTKTGDRFFRSFNFTEAADAYRAVMKKYPNDIAIKERLARTYVLMDDHTNAEALYGEIIKIPNTQAINKLYYGIELRANGKYDEAAAAFKQYSELMPTDARGKELAANGDKMKLLANDTKVFTIIPVPEVNSAASEMGPAFWKDGILFSSNKGRGASVLRTDEWTGRNFYDVYFSSGDHSGNKIKNKKVNARYHEGPCVVSPDGKELYFTRSNYIRSKVKKSKDKIVKLKIMRAEWNEVDARWQNVTEVPFGNNEYSCGHPTLSKDGRRMFFISDMPGGYGETDLYVSYKDGVNWGPPINLGKYVNTAGREAFPFMAEDGTLYFSSDSRTGLGGLDVYSAAYSGGEWKDVQNQGAPINTKWDDFGFIIDGKNANGYLASNRDGGKGEDDIYKFSKNGITLCGTVVDARTLNPLPNSEVKLLEDNVVIGTRSAGAKGDFCFPALPEHSYKVSASQKEYEPNSVNVTTTKANQMVQIPLSKMGGIDLNVCVNEHKVNEASVTSVGAIVEITNLATGEKRTCEIGKDCKCHFDLQPETDYEICATKIAANPDGSYDRPCRKITTKGKVAPASIYETLDLTYIEKGIVIKIENLYYDLNKWNIRPDAAIQLNKVLELMRKFPLMEIELSSHTDCRATVKYNDELSAKRAKSCVDYLIQNGVEGKRMIAAGYGERRLVNNCACEGAQKSTCTETQHQENRRTEFKVLKVK